jgi:integrase
MLHEPIVPKKEPCTYIPHAFTEIELKNFFAACDNLPNKTQEQQMRRITIPVFFRLLYSSGIRTYEARMLRTEDVDLVSGVLNIRYSKGHQQHYVVLHDSMLELMNKYDVAIRKYHQNRAYFFPAKNDSFHKRAWVSRNFCALWNRYNNAYATAYELRHHYAIKNIDTWISAGFEFEDKLLYLSKSMGHCNLESTKNYYSLTPGLADIIESQADDDFIIPEVTDNESL